MRQSWSCRPQAGDKVALEPQPIVPSAIATPADHLGGSVEAVGEQDHGLSHRQPAGDYFEQLLLCGKADGALGLCNPPRERQGAFAREILAWLAETGAPIPLILDQTKASDRHQILMLSVRWGERALPLAWRVAETEGAIGFATQQELLEVVAGWLSVGQAVILLADRFYGTPEMICWCGDRGWDYRLRLKGNLVARLGATRTTTGALALSGGHYFENIILTGKRITTNLGIIRDPGHRPWIIAMSAKPGYLTTLGYAARWGIEPMFSDFKSRGFGLQQTICAIPTASPA